jgi:hypothetical protein
MASAEGVVLLEILGLEPELELNCNAGLRCAAAIL